MIADDQRAPRRWVGYGMDTDVSHSDWLQFLLICQSYLASKKSPKEMMT